MGWIALAAWLLTAALSYAQLGGMFGRLVEGYERESASRS